MFELVQPTLQEVLKDAANGKLQLPDFQRGWVWEESAIASLIASLSRSFPVGALLTLRTGGEVRFQPRLIEGAEPGVAEASELLLDGQQRVTSLFQSLMRREAVDTYTSKQKRRQVLYYFDMERALDLPFPDDAVEIVDQSGKVTENIGRDVLRDLSTSKGEYSHMRFPANRVFDSTGWFNGWMAFWNYDPEKIKLFQAFEAAVLAPIRSYILPMIRLDKETTKEAVCLVFEKVNTGGKKLDAFELVTAIFAADGRINLRQDWYGAGGSSGHEKRLHDINVLRGIDRADFLRAISLAHTHGLRREAIAAGRAGKELPSIACTHAALLSLPAEAYLAWREKVSAGFERAAQFLHGRGLYWWKDVPYPSQITAMAAVFALRDNRPLSAAETGKLERWFWCGVFAELYGSTTDTRLANDVEDITRWLGGDPMEPRTIGAASFSESRLDTLYVRISAAYKGVHALLMKKGARDFLTGEEIAVGNYFSERFDIHHISPQAWCEKQGVSPARYNTIVNKTAISARTNRKIGGRAPSAYCATLAKEVEGEGIVLDSLIASHAIAPGLLRSDDFDAFYAARKEALLRLIERAMGKLALRDGAGELADYDPPPEEEDEFAASAA